jgi:Protein O-mannosyl-transferase TMEM260-like
VRRGLAAIAVLFLAAHLVSLPPTLDDIDSINFALGVRDFDVAHHQPHPPGYPLFIALGRMSTAMLRLAGVASPEVRGLALWSAIAGSLIVVLIFRLFHDFDEDRTRALIAAMLTAACPLFWFTALRPLSDLSGLTVALASMAAVAAVGSANPKASSLRTRERLLLAGAFIAGLAAGFRWQTAILTLPLLAAVLFFERSTIPNRNRLLTCAAGIAGVICWAIPMIVATGGPSAYIAALGSQAGEDFSGVVMLSTHPTPRVAMLVLLNTFVRPWHSPVLAGIMIALAASGFLVLLARASKTLVIVLLAFGPYAVFHILFQETVTTRYALPLVIPISYFVAATLVSAHRYVAAMTASALVVYALVFAVPAGIAFGHQPSPVFAMLDRMDAARDSGAIVGMHRRVFSESRRARQWSGLPHGTLLAAPRDYEWLEMTRAWREGLDGQTWFVADPHRTDLVLIDALARTTKSFRWPFKKSTYVGGARPDEMDWHVYDAPGWFLEQGWALTPEVAGITERDGWGPHRRPSIGWIRRRPGGVIMLIGGRHLGAATDPPVKLVAAIGDRVATTVTLTAGFFLHFETLPAGTLAGSDRFARLTVRAEPTTAGPTPRVGLEQFNVQDPDVVQFGFDDGWYEPEYNPETARSWRWMSERAVLRVHHAGRSVTLQITGESPMRYYRSAPVVSVTVGGRRLAEMRPTTDFSMTVNVPGDLLTSSDGRLVVESSEMFIPGDREGSADRRHLALRIYTVSVK